MTREPAPPAAVARRREEEVAERSFRAGSTHGAVRGPSDGRGWGPLTTENEREMPIRARAHIHTAHAARCCWSTAYSPLQARSANWLDGPCPARRPALCIWGVSLDLNVYQDENPYSGTPEPCKKPPGDPLRGASLTTKEPRPPPPGTGPRAERASRKPFPLPILLLLTS